MCLAAFAINASSRWPLVLASNRDEFFDRPALPLASWQTAAGNTVISGRDAQAGGTWLGITPSGRVALLTNVREGLPLAAPRSRGELVVRWLEGFEDAHAYIAKIDGEHYGGFNLLMGDLQCGQWHFWSNRQPGGAQLAPQKLENGVYGLSNAGLKTPWPKVVKLKSAMASALESPSQHALERVLWAALSDQERAAVDALPQTGVPLALELALSSARVAIAERNYGTRCTSLIVVTAPPENQTASSGRCAVSFQEMTYTSPLAATPSPATAAVCTFTLPGKSALTAL